MKSLIIQSAIVKTSKPAVSLKAILNKIWTLKRLNLFEFCDQSWLKGAWRQAYMDGLNTTFKMFSIHKNLYQPFCRWVSLSKKKKVLEVCSGGGGPQDTIIENAKKNHLNIPQITLSDLNPDVNAFEKTQSKHPEYIRFISEPVDAANTKSLEAELICLCSSFHHLPPSVAKKVLSNAYENSNGIFIREVLSRNIFNVATSFFNLLPLMLTPFFSGRFSLLKCLITTIVPIIPVMIIFDGIVSVLRTYTNEEIYEMMPAEMKRHWQWETGGNKIMGLAHAPYIFGYKR